MEQAQTNSEVGRTLQFIEVGGVRLEVRRWGEAGGVPILLLHEALGSVSMWRDFPARLTEATGRSVYAWSRQGFGRSGPRTGRQALDYLDHEADAIPALLDAIGVRSVHAFGHSDGAAIALLLAARHPTRVESLVLEAPHVSVEPMTIAAIARVVEPANAADLVARLGRHHDRPDSVFAEWRDTWLDPAFARWSIEDRLDAVRAPTLIIQGEDDEYFSMSHLDLIEARLARSERLPLPACGHSPHRDQPDAVLDATRRFLAAGTD